MDGLKLIFVIVRVEGGDFLKVEQLSLKHN